MELTERRSARIDKYENSGIDRGASKAESVNFILIHKIRRTKEDLAMKHDEVTNANDQTLETNQKKINYNNDYDQNHQASETIFNKYHTT